MLVSPGSDWPALFTAITRNRYSLPSMRPCTRPFVVGVSISKAFSHIVLYLSFFSMMYPVMGDPPSLTGSFQDNST